MKKFTNTEALEALCKEEKKWCLYLSWYLEEDSFGNVTKNPIIEIQKAVPFLDEEDISCDKNVILCDSEEEVYELFNQVVGDNGPTEFNLYDGPAKVYALVFGPDGMETENT